MKIAPHIATTRAIGYMDDEVCHIVIFLERFKERSVVRELSECWLHEFIESQLGGNYDHDYYAKLIERITKSVLAL